MNVLVVDDNDDVRRSLADVLTNDGHTVTSAVSGRQALDHLGRGDFGAVVLDLMLPAVDGVTLLAEMRAAGLAVPVVILSGVEALPEVEPPVVATFRKPVAPDELLNVLTAIEQKP